MTPDPALDAEVRSFVDDYRERCLWFVRSDYYPSTPDEILRNPWCVEDRIQRGATGDIAFARRNPLPRYEAVDFSLNVRESHSSIFPAR